jgi:hypothetical protein
MTEYEKLDILLHVIEKHPGNFIRIQEEARKQIKFNDYLEINNYVTRLRLDGHIARTDDRYSITSSRKTFPGYSASYQKSLAKHNKLIKKNTRKTLFHFWTQVFAVTGFLISTVLGIMLYDLRTVEHENSELKSKVKMLEQSRMPK